MQAKVDMKTISRIAVIGGGTMGQGIAQYFAMKSYPVSIYEPNAAARDALHRKMENDLNVLSKHGLIDDRAVRESLRRVDIGTGLEDMVKGADFIIEAAPENLALKQDLFKKLAAASKPEAILASNTSSLDLFDIIADLDEHEKKRCMICHWYNPAHLIPLVELSDFGNTGQDALNAVEALFEAAGKKTIRVLKNVPGLVANRIQQGIAREVFSLMEMQVASAQDIDAALKYGPAFRYATTGQLEVADFGGLDIWCTVGDNLLPLISNTRQASPLLKSKVRENKLGLKTGEGFFAYPDNKEAIIEHFQKKLITQLKAQEDMDKEQ